MLYKFFDALSLSGAIIFIFCGLTVYGIAQDNEKVWDRFGTALTTFATGKKIGEYEENRKKKKEESQQEENKVV